MRKGDKALIIFDKRGDIFALSTGTDACTEHECGSKSMQEALSGAPVGQLVPEGVVANTKAAIGLLKTELDETQLIEALRAGKTVAFTPLLDQKSLHRNLNQIVFIRGEEDGVPVGVFGYAGPNGGQELQLTHRELTTYQDDDIVGAWDERSFAWKVWGKRLVDKLERFAKEVREGDGVFAGTFLREAQRQALSGVILAVKSGLRQEHRVAISVAQAKAENDLRLKAKSRVDELQAMVREQNDAGKNTSMPGYVSPFWKDGEVNGYVEYRLNPNPGVKAQFGGTYTFEQLKEWILAEKKPELRPHLTVTTSAFSM